MKKVIIIGGGIAGLSAGIFARKQGFETEIYEMHSIPGGECTGWNRKGYHFDNCIHWLTGTEKENDLCKIWEEIGALENTEVYNFDFLYSTNDGNDKVYLYKDIDKLREHLLQISPEDKDEILNFIDIVKRAQNCPMPTKKPMDMMNPIDYVKLMVQYKDVGKHLSKLSQISVEEYANRFKNKTIRSAILEGIPSGYHAMSLFFMLGTFTSGNGGWPMGGSLSMALRIENKYKLLEGKIKYNSKVKDIIVENNEAKGIILESGECIYGDYVISAIDANMLMDKILKNNYKDDVFDTLFSDSKKYPIHSSVGIALGVKCDLSIREHTASFKVEPFKCGTGTIDKIGIKHFCHEKGFSPKDCSCIQINLICNDYEYWKNLKENSEEDYYKEKDEIAKNIINRIEIIYPETKGNFEVYDVNTPVTYERYCGAYRGAWMGFMPTANAKSVYHNGRIKGLKNLHVAGQWVMMPGGLPSACLSGKWAIQRICKDEKMKFYFNYC